MKKERFNLRMIRIQRTANNENIRLTMTTDFFSRISNGAQVAANNSNHVTGLPVFGGKYTKVEDSVKLMKDGVLCSDSMIRKPVAACVIETQAIDRYGSPFIRKDVRVYLQNPNGSVDGTFVSLRLNPKSPLQSGQWLNIDTLKSYQCERSGVIQTELYADGDATDTLPDTSILNAIGIVDNVEKKSKQDAKTTLPEKKTIESPIIKTNLSDKSKKWLFIYGVWALLNLIFIFIMGESYNSDSWFFPFDGWDLQYYDFSEFLVYVILLPFGIWGGMWLHKKNQQNEK